MGLYNRGRAVTGMYLDGKPVIRAYLGDRLVWDGSKSAFVSVPRIGVVMSAPAPEVSASSSVAVGVAAMAISAGAPSVTATALVAIPAAAMTLVVPAPVVHADANVSVEVVTIAMQALPAVGAVGADSTVAVPAAAVTMAAPAPTVAAHFEAAIPVVAVTMSAPAPVVTATGSAVVAVGVAEMTISAKAPVVTASSSVSVPVVTVGVSAKAPVVTASSTVAVPSVAVTMAAKNPVIQAINFAPSGMVKSGTQSTPNSSTRSKITGWLADSAYPGSTVSGDGLAVTGTRLVNVAAQITYTEAGQSFTANVLEIRNQSGTVLATGGATGSNRVQTVSASNVSVSAGDVLSLWASRGRASTVEASGTYLNFTW
jgi:hypothetical protein